MLSREGLERIEPLLSNYRREKRNFSELSPASRKSSPKHKLTKSELERGDVSDFELSRRVIKQEIRTTDAAIEARQAVLQEIK